MKKRDVVILEDVEVDVLLLINFILPTQPLGMYGMWNNIINIVKGNEKIKLEKY